MDETENTFVDIAKDELVVHILPTNTQLTVPNSPKGFRQLIKLFKDNPPIQIVCEATGGLERLLVAHLAAEGLGQLAKNLCRRCPHPRSHHPNASIQT